MRRRLLLLAVLAALIAGFFALGGGALLDLETLQARLDAWRLWCDAHPLAAAGGFFALYVFVTALSLPGAAALTLAAGALFGLWWGALLVSFASSLGALLAFLLSRHLLRDWVRRRFAARVDVIDAALRRDGPWYLFALRLVPVFPFFLINLAMGLTAMPAWTFYWVSQLGMLPGTLVYVNAGASLARIDRVGDVFSLPVLGAFALLGLFPLLARALLRLWQRRRVYRPWTRPRRFDRNLVVIGAGSAGLVAAYIAATLRARVTLVEAERMGGDCLNTGCVPSKALIAAAHAVHAARRAAGLGLDVRGEADFKAAMAHVERAVAGVAPHDSVERYRALGVDVVLGRARLLDPWTVHIQRHDGETLRLTTRAVVLAAGAEPVLPPIPGLAEAGALTSDTLWTALSGRDRAPESVLLLGGGPIGCELAQALARLGSRVTVVEMAERLLSREDEAVSAVLQHVLEGEGVEVLTGHRALRAGRAGDRVHLVVSGPRGERTLTAAMLIVAVGRRPRLHGLGLEALGIDPDAPLETDAFLQTRFPNIYAAGDLVGPYQFTHAAGHQAWYAAVNALFGHLKRFRVDLRVMPAVTYVDPEIARVGLNRREAQARGVPFEATAYPLSELDRAIAEDRTEGFVEVLTEPGRDRVLGATVVAPRAGELIAVWALAMRHRLGLNALLTTVHPYPTWAEANKHVAGAWRRAHAPERLLAWLARYHRWRRGG
ncbi:MAG: pyridine nucleotide-disulfide oxidoreductase [Gammaproteobacteria bacterium]|nr:MAG: pyridine nucleotide-disulfide oxidoreductase [Gammaproteobacteria bacterium]